MDGIICAAVGILFFLFIIVFTMVKGGKGRGDAGGGSGGGDVGGGGCGGGGL